MKIDTLTGPFDRKLPTLVCLHGSAGSASQWEKLAHCAAGYFNLVAHSLLGYGNAPASSPLVSMKDQSNLLLQTIRRIQGPIHLVGHSFGGAVAVHFTIEFSRRLSSLTVYEPISLDLLFEPNVPRHLAGDMRQLGNSVIHYVKNGELAVAAERFIDFWNSEGFWSNLPAMAQNRILLRMPTVAWEFQSAFTDHTDLQAYSRQYLPVQILYGSESPLTAIWMAKRLGELLPRSETSELIGLDHMGPMIRPEEVNPLVLDFADNSRGVQRKVRWVA